MTHPPELVAEIARRFGSLELDNRFPLGKDGRVDLEIVRRAADQKVDLTLWLAERFGPALLFVVFMAADHIQHLCWDDWERDGRRARSQTCTGSSTSAWAACSTGGAGPGRGGRLRSRRRAAPRRRQPERLAHGRGLPDVRPGSARLGRRATDRLFELRRHVPHGLRSAVKKRLPALASACTSGRSTRRSTGRTPEPSPTAPSGTSSSTFAGARRTEVVAPGEEYERVQDGIAQKLLDLQGPAGERIVAAVHRREDLFEGPELDKVPDLLVEFDEYAWLGKGNLKSRSDSIWDRIEIEPGSEHSYVGSHRHEGSSSSPARPRGPE